MPSHKQSPVSRLSRSGWQKTDPSQVARYLDLVKKGYYEGKCNSCEVSRREQVALMVKPEGRVGKRICYQCAGD